MLTILNGRVSASVTVALYMSHFKHNKIPHKITYGLVPTEGWPLNIGKNNKERQT